METLLNLCTKFDRTGIKYEKNKELSDCGTFRIGGKAALAVYPDTVDKLVEAIRILEDAGMRHIILGNASNIIFDSKGYDGAAVFTTKLNTVSIDGTLLTADCGASFTQTAVMAMRAGLSGLEFAYGIPGTVGGAVYMNAGAYDGETSAVLEFSEYYDRKTGQIIRLDNAAHDFSYRHSRYMTDDGIILRAGFRLSAGNTDEIKTKMDGFMSARKEKQPLEYPNAGSTFKRYPGYFTAKLIDEAGLKGYSVGGAQVSEKHAGFIINTGNATSDDVLGLVKLITDRIRENHGIEIEREVRYLPYDGDGVI